MFGWEDYVYAAFDENKHITSPFTALHDVSSPLFILNELFKCFEMEKQTTRRLGELYVNIRT